MDVIKVLEGMSFDFIYNFLLKMETKFLLNGVVSLSEFKKNGRQFYVISGEHYSSEAFRVMHEKIRPIAEKNPENWLFLVEGSPTGDVPEVIYGYLMGKKLGIPTLNPIKDPFCKEVVNKAAKNGLNCEDIYLALFFLMLKAFPNFNQVVDGLSKMWGISSNYLSNLINRYTNEIKNNSYLKDQKRKEFNKITTEIMNLSNELSLKELKNILAIHHKKTNIFVYLGEAHMEILNKI